MLTDDFCFLVSLLSILQPLKQQHLQRLLCLPNSHKATLTNKWFKHPFGGDSDYYSDNIGWLMLNNLTSGQKLFIITNSNFECNFNYVDIFLSGKWKWICSNSHKFVWVATVILPLKIMELVYLETALVIWYLYFYTELNTMPVVTAVLMTGQCKLL